MSDEQSSIYMERESEDLYSNSKSRNLRGLECLIPVINKLRDIFQKTGSGSVPIELPQIVVVGAQSAGKTTVLESLVGKNFLPRGPDLQTRCPIVLNLINSPNDDDDEYCLFEHKQGRRFTFDQVEREIREQTTVLAGDNRGITEDIIQINVHSPKVLTLTVVDLPGLVKIPTGDQPEDIEQQVKTLVMKYISQSNSVILAISAGNTDIANAEGIQLAKSVDPLQERTLAVITKLDLGGNLSDVLSGRLYPMKLGIVGVANRSETDIEAGVTFEEGLQRETRLINSRYPSLAGNHGTEYLSRKLNKVLMQHIQKCFPSLDMRVKQMLSERTEALISLGNGHDMTEDEKMEAMTRLLYNFTQAYRGQTDGQGRIQLVTNTLTGGARIDEIMKTTLAADLALLSPLDNITDLEMITAVRNATGIGMRLAQPELVLHHIIQKEVSRMKPVALHCTFQVHLVMKEMLKMCVDRSHRFRRVNAAISQVVHELLDENVGETRNILVNYVDIQASSGLYFDEEYHNELKTLMADVDMMDLGNIRPAYVHNDVILGLSNGSTLAPSGAPLALSDQQKKFCQSLRVLLNRYLGTVRKQVQDHVAKTLLHCLIRRTVDELSVKLSRRLCTRAQVDELIREPESITQLREKLAKEVESLSDASQVLDDVREASLVDD